MLATFASSSVLANTEISITLFDITQNAILTNGVNNIIPGGVSGAAIGSLVFSFVNPLIQGSVLAGWVLTTTPADCFVFGFDDPSSTNDNQLCKSGALLAKSVPVRWCQSKYCSVEAEQQG